MAKKCPPGKYYCFTDKKCKKIPRGYHIGARGYLARGDNRSDSGNGNGNGNGSSNGNGNGGNGAGNGNGGSGGNGGGNGGGGMGESIIYEKSNPRIPRKAGQPAKSKKHSDLYTDEDPKGTIHGLGFKDVAKAKASVSKIRNSSRSHAHKIQAAVAMEQRAREMGKTSEAAVYRKYINAMKKKTKRMNEAANPAQQAAIAIDMKKKGKKPKNIKESVGLITNAVTELEDGLKTLSAITYDSVDQLMQGIAKRNGISPTLLHNQFKAKHLTIPDDWAIRYRMNKMKGIEEATMTPSPKRKDTMLKNKYDKSDMKKSMQKQYGKEEGKKVYFATIRKQAMEGVEDDKYNVSEEGLRDWFGKSSGTTKSGRKVRGWVQVGGKYDGKPCARQPGQKSTPKCVSSSKRRSMSKKERDSAARRKRAADPGQPQKTGAAKPTNVSTDPKKKMSENYFSEKKMVKVKLNPEKKIGVKVTDIGPGGKEVVRKNTMNEAKDKKGKGSGTKDACYHKVKSRYSVWPSAYASGALVKCRKVGAANWGNKTKKEGFSPMQVAALEAAGMIELNEAGKKCWKGYKKAGTQKLFGKTYNRCVKAGDELNHDGEQLDEKMINVTPNAIRMRAAKQLIIKDLPKASAGAGAVAAGVAVADKMSNKTTNEGVEFLKRKKEEKKKSSSEYLTQRDAGKLAKRKMAKKDQEKVNFLEPEETNESKTRLIKNGHTYKVVLTWRGKTYMVQMFVPSVSRPTRQQVEKEVQKIYPDAKLMSFLPRDLEPGEPTVMMGEGKKVERDEYGDIVGGPKISKKDKKKNLAKNEKDEQHTTTTSEAYSSKPSNLKKKAKLTAALNRLQDLKVKQKMSEEQDPEGMKLSDVQRIKRQKQLSDASKKAPEVKNKIVPIKTSTTEEVIHEDDMKGMSVKSGHKRPTKAGAGMTKKGVEAYRRRNPGSKLKTAVTTKPSKLKKGSKAANRRKSYCARSAGQMKKFPKAAKDPNSRLRQARRRWKC